MLRPPRALASPHSSPRTALLTAIILLGTATLHAQSNEIGLLVGGTFTPSRPVTNDQPLKFDPALSLGIEYDHRLFKTPIGSLGAGIDFAASPFDVFTNAGPSTAVGQYAYLFLTPHLRFRLRSVAGFEPWASAGIGYANYKEGNYRSGSFNPRTGTTGQVGEFGVGVDFATPLKVLLPIGFRFEAKDFLAAPPSYNAPVPPSQNNVIVSFGLVLKF